jgi:hypothetical protein
MSLQYTRARALSIREKMADLQSERRFCVRWQSQKRLRGAEPGGFFVSKHTQKCFETPELAFYRQELAQYAKIMPKQGLTGTITINIMTT